MQSQKRIRRTREQWQEVIDEWKHTDQSAPQFCASRQLSYGVFCKWRRRLSREGNQAPFPEPQFINLGTPGLPPSSSNAWRIVLNLGEGVSLELSRS